MSFADIASTTDRRAETFGFTEAERKRILHSAQTLPSSLPPTETDILQKLETLKRRDTAWALHSSALAEYAKALRIPRGLRITLQPALFRTDCEFIAKWQGILNRCSLDLIALTVQQLQTSTKELKQQIHALEEEYKEKTVRTLSHDGVLGYVGCYQIVLAESFYLLVFNLVFR
ncbi:hypothetical protein XELAEV_18017346mg [Xenopus laevis]|uniref:Uncharacterized protein n=1 Tax=Xenopus laevis TaxID=8355 RepID=A0A974DDG6_XENLA|nr:hypothetical protein XELAEV_18017346mg [Xenopus laevis]